MKKLLMLLCAVTLILGMVGTASALSFYTDTVRFRRVMIAEGPIAVDLGLPTTHSYFHATPTELSVPWDYDVSATLTVLAWLVDGGDGGGDTVEVSESIVGTLTPAGSWWTPSSSMFDISPFFDSWSGGDSLGVTITAAGRFPDGIIKLKSSKLDLSWEDGTAPAPVPEPATILLMGAGLLGLVGYSRKRFSKKS